MRYKTLLIMGLVSAFCLFSACDDDKDVSASDSESCSGKNCDPDKCGKDCKKNNDDDEDEDDEDDEDDNDDKYPGKKDEHTGENTDFDGDTIPNVSDNCIEVANPDQADTNNNGLGDACDDEEEVFEDTDGDTIIDLKDNCRLVPNPDQADSNTDGLGDACSESEPVIEDMDGDTIPDSEDNCPRISNADQADSDGDGIGDVCTPAENPDVDGDTIPDAEDNCPDVPNHEQTDSDGDGIGDACAPEKPADADNDTIPDSEDNCPYVPNPDQADSNKNGVGDLCDTPDVKPDPFLPQIETGDGSPTSPFIIPVEGCVSGYKDTQDTSKSPNSLIDKYPNPNQTPETGPEYYYKFTLTKKSKVSIYLDSEPSNVDIDIQLLRNVNISNKTVPASDFINRSDNSITEQLDPGTYWIVADTYGDSTTKPGKYVLNVDITPFYAGTKEDPVLINCGEPLPAHFAFTESNSTATATSNVFNTYPGHENADESGPEVIYKFVLKERSRVVATIRKPEDAGADTDIHILSSLDPKLVTRGDFRAFATLDPGTYYLTADACQGKKGRYIIDLGVRPAALTGEYMFNDYILKAVAWLEKNWARRGYGSSAYTHDLKYGSEVVTKGPKAPLTMCVAAVAETILVAMDLYAQETGDTSVWNHLPKKSWASQSGSTIKGHIWCDNKIGSNGTGDALSSFGMGITVPFQELVPGSFINLNRSSGTGHAVVFLSFLDKNCKEHDTWDDSIIGFKSYSSQGNSTTGGFDYRYTHFEGKNFASGACSGKKTDACIEKLTNQDWLNTGVIYKPKYWLKTSHVQGTASFGKSAPLYFNAEKFNGITAED